MTIIAKCSSVDQKETSQVFPNVVFTSQISHSDVNGHQFNWQIPKGCIVQRLDKRRLGSALRFILLILAGDVELNPGPVNAGTVLIDTYCTGCQEECTENCIECEICLKWTHFGCTDMPSGPLKTAAKHSSIAYFCKDCVDDKRQDRLRAMAAKIRSRGVTLGNILDVYDRTQAQQSTASVACQSMNLTIPAPAPHISTRTPALMHPGHLVETLAPTIPLSG